MLWVRRGRRKLSAGSLLPDVTNWKSNSAAGMGGVSCGRAGMGEVSCGRAGMVVWGNWYRRRAWDGTRWGEEGVVYDRSS